MNKRLDRIFITSPWFKRPQTPTVINLYNFSDHFFTLVIAENAVHQLFILLLGWLKRVIGRSPYAYCWNDMTFLQGGYKFDTKANSVGELLLGNAASGSQLAYNAAQCTVGATKLCVPRYRVR